VARGPDNGGAVGAEKSTAEGTLGTPTNFLIEFVHISGVHLIVPGGSGPPDPRPATPLQASLMSLLNINSSAGSFALKQTVLSVSTGGLGTGMATDLALQAF
jgi:hypothetical protein